MQFILHSALLGPNPLSTSGGTLNALSQNYYIHLYFVYIITRKANDVNKKLHF